MKEGTRYGSLVAESSSIYTLALKHKNPEHAEEGLFAGAPRALASTFASAVVEVA